MEIIGGAANIGGLPFSGGAVSLSTADSAAIISASAGLAKALAFTGAAALGVVILSSLAKDAETKRDSRIPIGVFARITVSGYREFLGICQNENVDFICDSQDFSVPLNRVNLIKENAFLGSHLGYEIILVDGSKYRAQNLYTGEFKFISTAGEQSIFTTKERLVQKTAEQIRERTTVVVKDPVRGITIEGVTPSDISQLKQRLEYAIMHNIKEIIAAIGEENFGKFFKA